MAAPPVESLPWINGNDDDAMYYALPFLPKNPTIIEAGVCGGEDTRKFKKEWPNSIIYGFEAHPEHFALAKKSLENLDGVFLYPKALFDRTGHITFYCSKLASGASSILSDNKNNVENIFNDPPELRSYLDEPITVACTTIDDWAKESNVTNVDYIWLDTEGAELYILENAKTILSTVKVISTEINFQEFRNGMTFFDELYDFLTENGFVLKCIWGNPRWQAVAMFVNETAL